LGRLLRALSDSPVALSTSGTSVHVTRVIVFCISAFLAAIAGALSAMVLSTATGTNFPPLLSLSLIALVMISIGGAPWYALIGAVGIGVIPTYVSSPNTTNYLEIIFGVAAVMVALGLNPRLPASVRRLLDRQWISKAAESKGDKEVAVLGRVPQMALEIANLRVRFGGLVAVDGLNLTAVGGRITGLIGPNGAGKTTVFNACSGLVSPSAGHIRLDGRDITKFSPAKRARAGMGRTFQQMELFDSLSVFDNVMVGYEASRAGANVITQVWSRPGDWRSGAALTRATLELCGLGALEQVQVGALSTGQRRLVELARCLTGPFSILLLDEPSSGLDHNETSEFGRILRRLVDERDITILLVEHDMALVMDVCDDIFVLDFGTLIFEGSPQDTQSSEKVRAAYFGTEIPETEIAAPTP
jgi:ABC-type branched-subunit amino acid transport system ATPase component